MFLRFSHDGKRLASGSKDETVIIWNIEEVGSYFLSNFNVFSFIALYFPKINHPYLTSLDNGLSSKRHAFKIICSRYDLFYSKFLFCSD